MSIHMAFKVTLFSLYFRGEATSVTLRCSLGQESLKKESILKEKNLLLRESVLYFKSDFPSGWAEQI